jgi:hypothetical protein
MNTSDQLKQYQAEDNNMHSVNGTKHIQHKNPHANTEAVELCELKTQL